LGAIEPGGMLLTLDWQVYSPMLYAREVEKRRTDAVVIDINQLRRSWYFAYLKRSYPELMEQTGDKVDAFMEDLTHWEEDPDIYNRDRALNQRINTRFFDMIMAFINTHIKAAPVYITQEIAVENGGPEPELTKTINASYQSVPQGLVFQLAQP